MKGFEKQARQKGHQNSLAERQAKIADRRAQVILDIIDIRDEEGYDGYFSVEHLWNDYFSPKAEDRPYPASASTFQKDIKAIHDDLKALDIHIISNKKSLDRTYFDTIEMMLKAGASKEEAIRKCAHTWEIEESRCRRIYREREAEFTHR